MIEPMVTLGSLLAGGLITYLVTNYLSLGATDVELVNNQIEQFTKVEDAAVKYWLHDARNAPAVDAGLAALVNGAMNGTALFETDAKRLMRRRYAEYAKLDGELFDLVTGGAFQTASREPDCQRVVEIIGKCDEIRAFLRGTRRSVFGPR